MTVVLSGDHKQKMELVKQDGFSKNLLEIISKPSPFSDSLEVPLVTLRKMVLKTINNLAGREFFS